MHRLRLLIAAVVLVLLLPVALLTVTRDAEPPEELAGRVDEFRDVLARQLELPFAVARYLGAERGPTEFVVLRFELRSFPWVTPEGAYLVSRCTPLEALDPWSMGGGRGVTDWRTDHELAFLRAQADDPCP